MERLQLSDERIVGLTRNEKLPDLIGGMLNKFPFVYEETNWMAMG